MHGATHLQGPNMLRCTVTTDTVGTAPAELDKRTLPALPQHPFFFMVTKRRYRGRRAGPGVERGGERLGEDGGRVRARASKIMAHLWLEVAQYGGVNV